MSDEQFDFLNTLLEEVEKEHKSEVDDEENDVEMEEGVVGGLAKLVASGARKVAVAAAKGTVEGLLGPKEKRLMDAAAKNFGELLRVSGVNVTDESAKTVLDKILARSVVKRVEAQRGKEKAATPSPSKDDFKVVK